jgi:hypothetical protein
MATKNVIRCIGENHEEGRGNILLALDGDSIFVKCQDRNCRRWVRITLHIPGVSIDLSEAGIVQEVLPENTFLDLKPATVVVSDG